MNLETRYQMNPIETSIISFYIAGVQHANWLEWVHSDVKIEPGVELLLVKEPLNKYDPNAIAITTTDRIKLGYVPAKLTHILRTAREHGAVKCKLFSYNPNAHEATMFKVECFLIPDLKNEPTK